MPRRGADCDRQRIADAVCEYFPALAKLRSREAGLLSGGERQMLAIGSALCLRAASCCWWTSFRSGWRR